MRKIKFIIAFLIFASSTQAIAKNKNIIKQKSSVNIVALLKEKNIRLEEQNKMLMSSSAELRTSYYWSLGFASTFLLLFLGVNIYFLRNRYSEDKDYLLKYIDSKLREAESKAHDELINRNQDLEKKLGEMTTEKTKQSVSGINSKIDGVQRKIQMSDMNILELEVENEKRYGAEANLLMRYFELAQAANQLEWDWKTSACLVAISKLLEEKVKFDSGELPDVSTFLNDLPNQFNDIVHKIRIHIR